MSAGFILLTKGSLLVGPLSVLLARGGGGGEREG